MQHTHTHIDTPNRHHTTYTSHHIHPPSRVLPCLTPPFSFLSPLALQKLDCSGPLSGGHWQVVPEAWLMTWRKFIQSRDARRYMPPTRIDNAPFLAKVRRYVSI
jgi:hypothetical protein